MVDPDSHSTLSLSSLLCQETETGLLAQEDADEERFSFLKSYSSLGTDGVDDDEYVQMLLSREITSFRHQNCRQPSCSPATGNLILRARSDAIQWILNTRVLFGFGHQTAYLSVTYFDRFVAVRAIDSEKYWAARLLAVACLSLAAKMEECRVPALSDFPVEEFNFESNVMQRMELLVLNTLEWKMGSITPLAYIHYFLSKFCKQLPRKNIVSIVVELIFATVRDTNLMGYRPSAIASAAVLVALDRRLTRQDLELKINALSLSGFLDIENLFICYNRMQELLDTENIKLPKRIPSPDLSRIRLRGTHLCENSSITSFVVNKRKRLIFSDYDKNCDTPEEKRRR